MVEKAGLPMKQEIFLEAGVHIGTKIKTNDMKKYIFRRRDDGLYILDLRKSAERLISAAKLISAYKPEDVLVVASRVYSSNPATTFSKVTGIPVDKGRFIPGTMTNMSHKGFKEPKLIFVCDPKGEREAISEAAKNGVPIIALCDTDNETKYIDLVVPINNKGRRSLALIFFIIGREIALAQGQIKSYEEFEYDIRAFEQGSADEEEKESEATDEVVVATPEEKKEEAKPEAAPKKELKPEKQVSKIDSQAIKEEKPAPAKEEKVEDKKESKE